MAARLIFPLGCLVFRGFGIWDALFSGAMVSFTEGKFSSMLLGKSLRVLCYGFFVGFASDFETDCLMRGFFQSLFLPQIPILKWHSTTVATF